MHHVDEIAKRLHGKIGLIDAAYNSSDLVERRIARAFLFLSKVNDGGEGSGNHGHAGIPGHRGGSAKGTGGSAMRAGSKETGYTSFVKNAEFKGIASSASSHKDAKTWFASMTKPQQQALEEQHKACGTKENPEQYYERMHKMLSSRGQKTQKESWKPVEGRDITTSFKRNEKEYPHEINDVIHQQGFDGKPNVMESEEFDQFVKDNPNSPLLFRSYTAPDKETLAAYDKQLEEGDWYVDCSTGGAQYGQGMYTAGVYNTGGPYWKYAVNDEMRHYRELNENKLSIDNGFRDTPITTTFQQPKYMSCPINPDNAYKLPNNDDDWKSPEDVEFKTGAVYCTKEELSSGVSTYKTLYADDGKLYHIDHNLSVSETDLSTMRRNVKVAECKPIQKDELDNEPKSTTRRMALDPSAKIVTDKEIDRVRVQVQKKNSQDFIDSIQDPAPYIEEARKSYLGNLTPANVNKNAVNEVFEEVRKDYNLKTDLMKNAGIRPYAYNADDKLKRQIAYFFCGEASGYTEKDRTRLKPFFDVAEKVPAFKNEVQRLQDNAAKKAKSHWKDYIAEHSYMYKQIPRLPYDNGVFAAMMGYDAINAEGHGLTGSYTVVLNRSKLHIDKNAWEVN